MSSSSPDTLDVHMQQTTGYRREYATLAFKAIGLCIFLLFLVWNPLVLRPRMWNIPVLLRSLAIDAALLIIAVGLFRLRRPAALLASALSIFVWLDLMRTWERSNLLWGLFLLIPVFLTVAFWDVLRWGNKRRDPVFIVSAILFSGVIQLLAFATRRS